MYLSCLMIDSGSDSDHHRPGRAWLQNRYRVHQRLSMAFPSDTQRDGDSSFLSPFRPEAFRQVRVRRTNDEAFLFRVDPQSGGRVMIIVQSAVTPDWNYAFQNAPFLAAPPQVKSFEPRFERGQTLQFRLIANPTKKTGTITKQDRQALTREELLAKPGRHGRRVPVPPSEFENWLHDRAVRGGFRVIRFDGIQAGYVLEKSEHTGANHLRSACYEGVLAVEDGSEFKATIVRGIGPGKAFGFGLLSVAGGRT